MIHFEHKIQSDPYFKVTKIGILQVLVKYRKKAALKQLTSVFSAGNCLGGVGQTFSQQKAGGKKNETHFIPSSLQACFLPKACFGWGPGKKGGW